MDAYFTPDGTPCTYEVARPFLRDKRVLFTSLTREGERINVSTVYLGLNHQFGDGPPLIYESMVFPEGEWAEQDCDRYSTRTEAEAGHARMVASAESLGYVVDPDRKVFQ